MFIFQIINHNTYEEENMTQKELLYLEDAIGHEQNIISIIEEKIEKLEDEKLVEFMQEEINKHNDLKQNLIAKLEEKSNE